MENKTTCGVPPERIKQLLSLALSVDHEPEARAADETVSLHDFLTPKPGAKADQFKIIRVIGEGGMGIVYLAEQQHPVRRRVALKEIKPGMDSRQIMARFEAEQQALALMDHPYIARVFSAGLTESGRPFFAMEYVLGLPIIEFCNTHKLDIHKRLALFLHVCDAIRHAHQKGIIHRDLKPSNILVAMQDNEPVPKVIDFGVARAVSQPLTQKTLYTEQGQMIGTPEYMSPEQADSHNQDIDTRTDVYALGVILYELLTGILPHDPRTLREGGIEHIRRVICEQDPKTPSTRLKKIDRDTSLAVASQRQCNLATLGQILKGDLDCIVIKAMEKERARRYETVHAFAQDIHRFLNDEPISARPPSGVYRAKKFLRRHRRQVAALCFVCALAVGLLISLAILRKGLDHSRQAEIIRHETILSETRALGDQGKYDEALTAIGPLMDSKHVGPEARLLHARLLMMARQSSSGAVTASDTQWTQIIQTLKDLLNESNDIAGQAHFLLATLYYESDPEAPASTREFKDQWSYHQQKANELLPETADSYLLRAISATTVPKALAYLERALALDGQHFESIKTRAYIWLASANHRQLILDATQMKTIQPDNALGYALCAIAQRELGWFADALTNHDAAILLSPTDVELVDQRRQTHMRQGEFQKALSDAVACVRLKPTVNLYQYHHFLSLVAVAQYDEAKSVYAGFSATHDFDKGEFSDRATRHVFDTLGANLAWHPPDSMPMGKEFLSLHKADEYYKHLSEKAKRLVVHGTNPSWSPDGSRFVFTQGIPGSTGIAMYDMKTQETQLLTLPGAGAVWSPNGDYIAYGRYRNTLPFSVFSRRKQMKGFESMQLSLREIWIIKADGTESPRFVAKGICPSWSHDSKKIYYQSTLEEKLYSIPVDVEGAKPHPLISVPSWSQSRVSPNEDYLAYASDGSLHIVDLKTGSTVKVIDGFYVHFANWTPDGRSLILDGYWGTGGLWFYDVESKVLSRLFRGSLFNLSDYYGDADNPRLLFSVITTGTLWGGNEIWMADMALQNGNADLIGSIHSLEAHHKEVIDDISQSIAMDPEELLNYQKRAERYMALGDVDKALQDVEAFAMRAQKTGYLARSGHSDGLRELMTKLIDAKKGQPISTESSQNGLAWAYFSSGLWAQETASYEDSILLFQGAIKANPKLSTAYHHLAQIQATCPVPQWRQPALALQNAGTACELTGWSDPLFIDTYAAAQAGTGDFKAAVAWQQEALQKLSAAQRSQVESQMKAKLTLYQAGSPYFQQYLWPDSLIAWWPLTAEDKARIHDISGNNLHGRFMGDACIATDPDRGAVLSLDGEGDFVDCGNGSMFNLTESLTVCAWIKSRVLNKKWQVVISHGDKSWLLLREAGTDHMQLTCYGVSRRDEPNSLWGFIAGQTNVSDGLWHHLVGVYDGTIMSLYMDGQLDAKIEATGRVRKNNFSLFIGENAEKPNREWHGLIDDVRIYSTALTAQEIQTLFKSTSTIN
ncbi:MAG: protein kinase [Phycisphaerae bacterium]|nr:protein kinase [Phycisphaerae bacterium]